MLLYSDHMLRQTTKFCVCLIGLLLQITGVQRREDSDRDAQNQAYSKYPDKRSSELPFRFGDLFLLLVQRVLVESFDLLCHLQGSSALPQLCPQQIRSQRGQHYRFPVERLAKRTHVRGHLGPKTLNGRTIETECCFNQV